MAQDRERFLSRWSKRKLEGAKTQPVAEAKASTPAEAQPPELPPVEQLTPDSDFSAFMREKVDERLRRAALKKLFSDPRFNVLDGLDEYADDYTKLESLAPDVARQLQHARTTLFGREPEQAPSPVEPPASPPDLASADSPPAAQAQNGEGSPAEELERNRTDDRREAPPDPEPKSG